VKGFSNIYALGDCAENETKGLPATAQAASQHGAYLAKRFNTHEYLQENSKPFKFRFLGLMTYIGGYQSIMVPINESWHPIQRLMPLFNRIPRYLEALGS